MPTTPSQPRSDTALAILGLRKRLGYTQEQFARLLGLTTVSIARLESKNAPGAITLNKLIQISKRFKDSKAEKIFQESLDRLSGVLIRRKTATNEEIDALRKSLGFTE